MGKKYVYKCRTCGFEFLDFSDENTVHELLTGHREYEIIEEAKPSMMIRFIMDHDLGLFIEIPWTPDELLRQIDHKKTS